MARSRTVRNRLHVSLVVSEVGGRTGVSTHVRDLAKYLSGEGNGVSVISRDVQDGTGSDGIRYVRVPDVVGLPQPLFIFLKLLSLHQRDPVDVVHVHDSVAFLGVDLFCRVSGVRSVFTMQASILSPGRDRDYAWHAAQIFQLTNRYVCRASDLVICPSREMVECALRGGAPPRKIRLLFNPVDSELFAPGASAGGRGGRRNGAVQSAPAVGRHVRPRGRACLFVGGFRPVKGPEVLVRAIPHILENAPDAHFVMVGDGPERDRCEELARLQGIQDSISFVGHVPYQDLPSYYGLADLFVMPSLNEPMGLALMQALSCGVPVVASEVGGIPEIVRHGRNGLLVPPGDERALAEAIIEILSDDALGRRLRDGACATGAGLTWNERIGQFTETYRQIVREATGGRDRSNGKTRRRRWPSSSALATTGTMPGGVASN